MLSRLPMSSLFPYTTLFRSALILSVCFLSTFFLSDRSSVANNFSVTWMVYLTSLNSTLPLPNQTLLQFFPLHQTILQWKNDSFQYTLYLFPRFYSADQYTPPYLHFVMAQTPHKHEYDPLFCLNQM